jgi:tetratricopeptide (TPR) repeat protein
VKKGTKIALALAGLVLIIFVGLLSYLAFEVTEFTLGRASFQKGYEAENRRDYKVAVDHFSAALRKPLGSYWRAYAFENRGACFAWLGRREEAIRDYTEALRAKPDLGEVYGYRGYAYAGSGERELALRDYDEAIRRYHNAAEILYYRGLIYSQLKNYQKARADFREAIRASPDFETAYVESGFASNNLNDRDGAISAFEEAIRLKPEDPRPYFGRSRIYFREKEYDRTAADLTKAIQLAPNDADYRIARATIYVHQGRLTDQIADLTEALQTYPTNETLLLTRGRAFHITGNYPGAIADFTELIKHTQAGGAYKERARTYFRDGQYALALADYKQATASGGTIESNAKPLAWLLATCPDPKFRNGAEAIIEATKECDRKGYEDSGRLDTLAAAYAEAGKFDEAANYQRWAASLHDDKDPEWQTQLESRLDLYLRRQPYREEVER